MNEYVTVILGVFLIYEAVMGLSGNEKFTRKMKGKYTPESLVKYSKVTGAGSLLAGVVFIVIGLGQLGLISFGPDFNDSSVALIAYGVTLVILIALLVGGRVAVLKPLDGAVGGKKNTEDEDY